MCVAISLGVYATFTVQVWQILRSHNKIFGGASQAIVWSLVINQIKIWWYYWKNVLMVIRAQYLWKLKIWWCHYRKKHRECVLDFLFLGYHRLSMRVIIGDQKLSSRV